MRVLRLGVTLVVASVALASVGPASAAPPRGYRVVTSRFFDSPTGITSQGFAFCPGTKVPFGGGVSVSGTSTGLNVNTSEPFQNGWRVVVSNSTANLEVPFTVTVVCGRRPRGYTVVRTADMPIPPHTQRHADAACPDGMQPVGGGSETASFATSININSTFPNGQLWSIDENNAGPDATTFAAFAVCAKLKGYAVAPGPFRTNRAGDETFLPASCPAPLVPVGGGAFSRSGDPAVDLAATGPNGTDWTSVMNNGSATDSEAESLAVCAGS